MVGRHCGQSHRLGRAMGKRRLQVQARNILRACRQASALRGLSIPGKDGPAARLVLAFNNSPQLNNHATLRSPSTAASEQSHYAETRFLDCLRGSRPLCGAVSRPAFTCRACALARRHGPVKPATVNTQWHLYKFNYDQRCRQNMAS